MTPSRKIPATMVPARRRLLSFGLAAWFAVASVLPMAAPASAQGRPIPLVRDSEIEEIIRGWGAPIFAVAGLSAEGFKIHLVNERQLNAFVIGGQQMFINTGLLMRSDGPGQVIGVIAHETGHLAGGHVAKLHREFKNTRTGTILAFILGAAAGIAAQDGRVAAAVISAGQSIGQRSLFSFTRAHEQAADQFALNALEATGQSAKGLAEFLGVLESQEFLTGRRVDPYVRTHPITGDRVNHVREHLKTSRYTDTPPDPRFVAEHKRMKAKLIGFLEHPLRVYQIYRAEDNSLESRYARAIAQHREANTEKSLALIDSLLKDHPKDPYFLELKGQVLFESGRPAEAIPPYTQAVRLRPGDPLFRTMLAAAQLETARPGLVQPALAHLKHSARIEPGVPRTWRLLATAHGKLGDKGMTMLSLAEESLLLAKPDQAAAQAKHAESLIKKGTPAWLRAKDIQREAERLAREIKRR